MVSKNSKSDSNKLLNKNTKITVIFYATISSWSFFLDCFSKEIKGKETPQRSKNQKLYIFFLTDTFLLNLL